MDGDMFCFIYKGGLVKVDDGTNQYIGDHTFSLEIDDVTPQKYPRIFFYIYFYYIFRV